MIVKNEEDTISNCLNSVSDIFDEIIIVDTGSTDKTKEVLKEYNVNIYDFEWIDDFSATRNFSFSKATSDYIMWLDADDILKAEDRKKLIEIKDNLDGSIKQYATRYAVSFDNNGKILMEYYRERIFLREKQYRWIGKIHEVILMEKDILYTDLCITHNKIHPTEPGRNLRIFEKMIKRNENLNSRETFYYGRELFFNRNYEKAIDVFSKCINDENLWLENRIQSHIDSSECYRSINQFDNSLKILFSTFMISIPRAEVCCKIGEHFTILKKYNEAIYWYHRALESDLNVNSGAFVNLDAYNYIPYIQLCYLYYQIGKTDESRKYNDLAGLIKPDDSKYIYNKNFFKLISNSL